MWKLSFDEHHLDWDEGNEGRAILDTQGNLHSWNEEDGGLHKDWLDNHPHVSPYQYLYIDPDGRTYSAGVEKLSEADADHLRNVDPRLNPMHEEPWEF